MNIFLINIMLAFIWSTVTGDFSVSNQLIGFALGYLILLIVRPVLYEYDYARHFWQAIFLAFYFIKELFVSSLRVAIDVAKPGLKMKSGIVAIPLDVKGNVEITMLANLISLTPGMLSLDVSEDESTLYIHAMYVNDDVDAVIREVKDGMEKQLLKVLGR